MGWVAGGVGEVANDGNEVVDEVVDEVVGKVVGNEPESEVNDENEVGGGVVSRVDGMAGEVGGMAGGVSGMAGEVGGVDGEDHDESEAEVEVDGEKAGGVSTPSEGEADRCVEVDRDVETVEGHDVASRTAEGVVMTAGVIAAVNLNGGTFCPG